MSLEGNAGVVTTEAECHGLATLRASALAGPVYVLEHVGGVHPSKGPIAATGQWMWRDAIDTEGRQMEPPPRFWRVEEIVQP